MNTENTSRTAVIRERGEGLRHNILGALHVYQALAAETGGGLTLFENFLQPGTGAPPHTHAHEDESFYILEGEVTFEIEGRNLPLKLGPGSFVFAPRGGRHAFRNEGNTAARMLVLVLPGTGLEQMFTAFDKAVARSGGAMPAPAEIVAIAARNDVVIDLAA